MSAQTVLPTTEHAYIGTSTIPLNLPTRIPSRVRGWVAEVANLTMPEAVHWCDGSIDELDRLYARLVTATALTSTGKEPDRFRHRASQDPPGSHPAGPRIFSCRANPDDIGPADLWAEPAAMRRILVRLFGGCMRGRIMYVAAYSLASPGAEIADLRIELTDSPFVAVSLADTLDLGVPALGRIVAGETWLPAVHSVGYPLLDDNGTRRPDVSWPCSEEKWIAQFPDSDEIWSYGTGFATSALLG